MAVRSWIRNLFAGKASKTRASAARRGLSRKPRRTLLCVEALEDRLVPAVTSFDGAILTVDLNNASEAATLSSNDAINYTLSSNNAITGAGASFSIHSGFSLVVTDAGNHAGQSITFAGTTYVLESLDSSGVETNTFNVDVLASHNISVTAPQSIVVNQDLRGGYFSLSSAGETTLLGLGTAALNTVGVKVQAGAVVSGTGKVTVQGTGCGGDGNSNYGVLVSGDLSAILSQGDGALLVTGQGGGGAGSNNFGVRVENKAKIDANGSGTVTVQGTGGTGSGNSNIGVNVALGGTVTRGAAARSRSRAPAAPAPAVPTTACLSQIMAVRSRPGAEQCWSPDRAAAAPGRAAATSACMSTARAR